MTPIFSRSWFVKMQIVSVRLSVPASLRSAWLISRACRPTWLSPISPSISAFGVSAATESTATMSTAPERIEELGDLERLLAGVGLRDEQLVDVDADPARVRRIHRVLGVDERADAATPLRLRDHVVDERRLPRGLGAEDLDDASARQARRSRARGRARASPSTRLRSRPGRRRSCASPTPCRTAARSGRARRRALPPGSSNHPPAISETRSSTSYRAPVGCSRER